MIKKIRFYQLYYLDRIKKVFGGRKYYNDLIYLAQKSIAHRFYGEADPMVQYIAFMNILQQDKSMKKGLEIGGGYSTIVLTKLVIENNCDITSIDINPAKYDFILPKASYRKYLFSLVEIVEDLTIDFNSLSNYYEKDLAKEISSYPAAEFKAALEKYIRPHDQGYLPADQNIISSLYKDGEFDLYQHVLTPKTMQDEKGFYQQFDRVKKKGFVSKIIDQNIVYDFIFFDCGELSSLVEWTLLKNQIRVGGYAILHDIYFPKSVKNFIVAAFIELSKDWEIIYQDNSSTQGLLVAKRSR